MTQKQLAEYLGLNRATISFYETGGVFPSVEIMIKIANYFKVSCDFLMGLTSEREFDMTGLTDDQIVSIDEIIRQYTYLNSRLSLRH